MKKSTLKLIAVPAIISDYVLINLFVKRITLKTINSLYNDLIDGKIKIVGANL